MLTIFSNRRDRGTLITAAQFLRDPNLVWSQDFESVRRELASLLSAEADFATAHRPYIVRIANEILEDRKSVV